MAVNLIISPTFEYAKSEILKKIASNNKPNTSHLVIVPDRHSLSYQRAVIEELGLVSVSNIEVVSFSRLADLNITKDKKYLTPQSAVMLMRRVINRNKQNLLRYRKSSNNVGFADEMFAVVSDIRNSNISSEKIASNIDGITNTAMRNKISDIALLYSGYIEELEKRYLDATSKFGALIDIIDDIDLIKNSYVYVCDYYEFTNVELELLERIMNEAKEMNISLVEKKDGSNRRIFPHLSAKLIAMAKKNNHKVTIKENEMHDEKNAPIYNNLFGYVNDVKSEGGKPIYLGNARNIEEEISYVAASISKSVRERGLRYRDIAIAIGDLEGYKDTLKTVLNRYHIPYYVDDKVPIMSAPSVRHIMMAIRIIQGRYKRSDVVSFLMNGLSTDITLDEKDIFTNYVMKYNIDRSRFTSPLTITDKDNSDDLELINSVRKRMFVGFDILEKNNVTQKMSLHIDSIYQYIEASQFVEKLNVFAKTEFDMGYKVESGITTQAPKKLFRFFEELLMVAGDEEMSQKEFLDIMLASLERVDISLIPKFNDCVYIGDIGASRYDEVKEMYFMGMTEGNVPQDMSTRGIMGQSEVDVFASLGMNIEPSPKEKNLLNRFYILELLMKGEDKIYLTYPSLGSDGKEKSPSIVMRELAEIYKADIGRVSEDMNVVDFMSTYDNANYLASLCYGNYSYSMIDMGSDYRKIAKYLKDEDRFQPFDYKDEENVADIHDLYFSKFKENGNLRMSASKIETYLRCPYRAYLQYVLGLKERDVYEIKVSELGTILHEMLELLFGREIDLPDEKKARMTDEEVIDFVHEYADTHLEYDDKIKHEILNRCEYVALKTYNMIRKMSYQPSHVEYRFENEKVQHAGETYLMNGSIDRVDKLGDKSYLVDYKSSSNVEFKLKNIYFGDRVQLVMYADMFKKLSNEEIVGLFYMPMPGGFTKVEDAKENFKFNGVMTTDDVSHMPEGIYPYKHKVTKKSDTIVGDNGEVVTPDDMDSISHYVDRLIDNVILDIKDGYIAKNPIKGKCEYCDYKNICGMYGEKVNGREMCNVEITAFGEEESHE